MRGDGVPGLRPRLAVMGWPVSAWTARQAGRAAEWEVDHVAPAEHPSRSRSWQLPGKVTLREAILPPAGRGAQAVVSRTEIPLALRSSASSPDWNISRVMSQPPMNSPLT